MRLDAAITSGLGRVLIRWSEPVKNVRLSYDMAFRLAKRLVEEGQRAETEAEFTADRTTPVIVDARFRPEGTEVCVDLGTMTQLVDLSPAEAFAFANALVITGERAQRCSIGLVLTPLQGIEERFVVGIPRLVHRPRPQTLGPQGVPSQEAFGKIGE